MSKPIRTLHINTEATWRGGEQQTLYLLRGLASRGFPVLLCAQKGGRLAERAREAGIDTIALRMRGEIDVVAGFKIARKIRSFRPDILQYHTSHAHSLGILANFFIRGRRPQTLLTRRVDFSIYRHSFLGLNHLKYNRADHIVAISEAIQKVLLEDGMAPERVDCVPSGTDPERFSDTRPAQLREEFGLPPDTKLLGNIAFFADHKGQRYLVEAAKTILKECPKTAIFLIGEGPLLEPLQRKAEEEGIGDRVFFPGFRRDVPAILRDLDVYVMPSHKEGLGTAILDAMYCGVPVVASEAGGMPELVHHEKTGLLVPPHDSTELAQALIRMLSNPQEAATYAAAGRKLVEEYYTVNRMVSGNIRVYEKLLAAH